MANIYIIDADSLITLIKLYPREVFASLLEEIDTLISEQRLIAPREVFREIAKGDDAVEKWAKSNRQMFVDLDAEQASVLKDVLQEFPGLHDHEKTDADADPVLVALCLAYTRNDSKNLYSVVTEEKLKGPGSMKLPNVCKELKLDRISLLEMFHREGYRF